MASKEQRLINSMRQKMPQSSGNDIFNTFGWHDMYEIPKGFIGMWAGTIASIPKGWALCDGTNGSPDMRELIPRGAGAGADGGGATGIGSHCHAAGGIVTGVNSTSLGVTTGLTNVAACGHTHCTSGNSGAVTALIVACIEVLFIQKT